MEKITFIGLCFILVKFVGTEETVTSVNDDQMTDDTNSTVTETPHIGSSTGTATFNRLFGNPIHSTSQDRIMRDRHRSRQSRLSMIRQQVLDSLGWEKPPEINSTIRRIILQNLTSHPMFSHVLDNRQKNCYAATCMLPAYIHSSLWTPEGDTSLRLYFDVITFDESEKSLSKAELKLHMRRRETCECGTTDSTGGSHHTRLLVTIYQYLRPLRRRRAPRKRIIDVKMVTWEGNSWATFTVTQAAQDWVFGNVRNVGLEVVVKDTNENIINANEIFDPLDCNSAPDVECTTENEILTNEDGTTFNAPILEATTANRNQQFFRRRKRAIRSQMRELSTQIKENGGCKKLEMEVNLRDSIVLSPLDVTTAVCVGRCSACVNDIQCSKACQPTKTESLELSFFDKGRILHATIPDIIVKECGCGA
ncbi:hypothetical protein ScPMuIL_016244 [Solemya velum]